MFDFLTPRVTDPALGELTRRGGLWRGTITVDGHAVPLALTGPRAAPDAAAVAMARDVSSRHASWRDAIGAALFEHYEPYADAEDGDAGAEVPRVASAADVWPHVTLVHVSVVPFDGALAVELGYAVAWDGEHTLGARLREGRLLELSGSV